MKGAEEASKRHGMSACEDNYRGVYCILKYLS